MFPHRINHDGTIDSICSRCYITVGTSSSVDDLERMESAHLCDPERLRFYEEPRETPKRPPRKKSSPAFEVIRKVG